MLLRLQMMGCGGRSPLPNLARCPCVLHHVTGCERACHHRAVSDGLSDQLSLHRLLSGAPPTHPSHPVALTHCRLCISSQHEHSAAPSLQRPPRPGAHPCRWCTVSCRPTGPATSPPSSPAASAWVPDRVCSGPPRCCGPSGRCCRASASGTCRRWVCPVTHQDPHTDRHHPMDASTFLDDSAG